MKTENRIGMQKFSEEKDVSNTYMVFLKALIMCLLLTFLLVMVYALLLSFTPMSDSSMNMVTQIIIIICITISSIYGSKKLCRKGWLFGLLLGLVFVLLLIPVSMIFGQPFVFDKYLIAKTLMGSFVGLIGGIIGVNLN